MKNVPSPRLIEFSDDALADDIGLDIVLIATNCIVAVAALIYLLAI